MRLDGMTWERRPGQIRTVLRVATCMMVLCTSIQTRPPQDRARPIASASAPSSANLAPTKIRQVRRPAKLAQPIRTALLELQVVTTTPPVVQQEHVLVERRQCAKLILLSVVVVMKDNTKTKPVNQVAKVIVVLGRT